MASKKHKRISFSVAQETERHPATIVSEPGRAYMRPEDGKLVPLAIIDTTDRPDIAALFAAYTPATVGNVAVQWGQRRKAPKGSVSLFLKFTAPVEQLLILDFEIIRQSVLVEEVLRTGELYLQRHQRPDEPEAPAKSSKIRVVVPDTGFAPHWEELLVEELSARSRALGATERQARLMAQDSIRRWRTGPQ